MPDKPEQTNPNQPRAQSAQSSSTGSTSSSAGSTRAASGAIPAGKVLGGEKRQFIIAMRRLEGMMMPSMGFQPLTLDHVEQALRSIPDIELMDSIGPKGASGTLADGMGGIPNILIAKIPDDKAEVLRQQSRGQLIVERDQPLQLWQFGAQRALVTSTAAAGSPALATTIVVVGKDNTPVKDAEVYVFGSLVTFNDVTDERGQVKLSLYGETVDSVLGLYVKPKSDYWTFYQSQPALDTNQPNLVLLRPLSDTFPDFPRQETLGWGQRVMRLEQVPGTYRGQGARVGLIDSGVATTHADLQAIRYGVDFANKKEDQATWNRDVISHGSHAAGIIAGAENGVGIRGFAPEAEVHVCRLFPGGQVSQLIDALEYCIEKQIDVVNLSLGGCEPSEALEQQILRAKRLGVACIVAAGNTGGPVEYPASSPHVLAVAAIGRVGEFPPDSYHAQTVTRVDASGLFSPKFTCLGPEIGLCAPGVAILSSVPPNNYSVRDGTSLAASHVTGLAALVVAHHPDFQGAFRARNSDRVERLFQILKLSAQPVNLGDPRRTGFGLPDVPVALGLAPRLTPVFAGMIAAGLPAGPGFLGQYLPYGMSPAALYNMYAQGSLSYGSPAAYPGHQVPVSAR